MNVRSRQKRIAFGSLYTVVGLALGALLVIAPGLLTRRPVPSENGQQPTASMAEPAAKDLSPSDVASAASKDRRPSGVLYVAPEQLAKFQADGHSLSDIYTARSLEEQTGVPIQRWLNGRRQGKEFPALIEELAKDKKLERRKLSDAARNLTEAEINAFVDEGYAASDILAAGEVLAQYGGDPKSLLKRHSKGESWSAINEAEYATWRQDQETRAKEPAGIRLGKDGFDETTSSGLTKTEISAFLKQGSELAEILAADSRAHNLGLDLRQIAREKQADQTWDQAITAAYQKAHPEQEATACPLPTRAQLDARETESLLAAGETNEEIQAADSRAHVLSLDLHKVIAQKKKGEKLMAAVERAQRERTPAERAALLKAPHPDEEVRIKSLAKQMGRTESEIAALRKQGKAWVEIAGFTSPDGQPTHYDLADSWGITDHRLVERAMEIGYSLVDIRQASLIANQLGLATADVLAMKTTENTWTDVIKTLSDLPIQP